jgi:hypothetical protein
MATSRFNWCRGPGCHNLIETPWAHCCLDCERAEKRALEAGKPRMPVRQGLSITEGFQLYADAAAATYAQSAAANQARRP